MPTYTFHCNPANNGCDHQFEIYISYAEYDQSVSTIHCPKCKQLLPIERIIDSPHIFVPKTVGYFCDKNSDTYSLDHKEHLKKEHYKYRTEDSESPKELPSGMQRMKQIDKKQRKKDPRKIKKAKNG